MAMTKKEKAEFDAAIYRAQLIAALLWTAAVEPDVNVPERGFSEGWLFNPYTMEVWESWSDQTGFGRGPAPIEGNRYGGTQGSRKLYSSKKRAFMALRHAVEKEAAAKLLKIDKLIEAATS
jgi:hypothetical protein